jgi:hypothetical protein
VRELGLSKLDVFIRKDDKGDQALLRHCERSEAIQGRLEHLALNLYHVTVSPSEDEGLFRA